MAGGQERVLRRRIKRVQSTKKITRAMELIAASRIAKAQQRANAARPYSERITEVIRTWPAGAAQRLIRCSRRPRTIRKVGFVVISSDRGLAGGYNTSVIRACRARDPGQPGRGRRDRPHHRRQEGPGLLRLPRLRHHRELQRLQRLPELRGRPRASAEFVTERFGSGESRRSRWPTPGSSPWASRASWSARSCPSTGVGGEPTGAERAASATTSSSPSPDRSSSRLLPRYARPGSTPPSSTRRPPSTPAASGP